MAEIMVRYWIGCKRSFMSIAKGGILPALMVSLSMILWAASSSFGQERLSLSGITEPIKDVTLSATVIGTISAIFLKEGMSVKKGEAILELDKKAEELEVGRRKLLWESKAEVEGAAVRVTTLKSQLESTRELFKSTGSVSREEVEKMELDYELAVAEKERLKIAEDRERIEYEMALESLRKRTLISPIQGTIIKLFLDVGETCNECQPLAHVVDTSRGVFVCNVEEWVGRTLRKGQPVDLNIRTGSESIAKKGAVVFVSPVVDPASGLLEVKAEFDNQDGSVRPGVAGTMLLKAP